MTQNTTTSRDVSSIASENVQSVVDAVREDPGLLPEEKETTMYFGNRDDRVSLCSEQGGMIRRLLRYPLFEFKWVRVYDDESTTHTIRPSEYTSGYVTAINGTLPIGALKFQSDCRSDSMPCKIVSRDALVDVPSWGEE